MAESLRSKRQFYGNPFSFLPSAVSAIAAFSRGAFVGSPDIPTERCEVSRDNFATRSFARLWAFADSGEYKSQDKSPVLSSFQQWWAIAQFFKMLWDWWPAYKSTNVNRLESRRSQVGIVLIGQCVVALLRLMSGHGENGLVGAMVFFVGYWARCSLQSCVLTLYIALSFVTGAVDLLDLAKHACSSSSDLFFFPYKNHVQDCLSTIAMVLAPVCEIGGIQSAWRSYLHPSLLDDGVDADVDPSDRHSHIMGYGTQWPSKALEHQLCCQCRCTSKYGWYGTGMYASRFYCQSCWQSWVASP